MLPGSADRPLPDRHAGGLEQLAQGIHARAASGRRKRAALVPVLPLSVRRAPCGLKPPPWGCESLPRAALPKPGLSPQRDLPHSGTAANEDLVNRSHSYALLPHTSFEESVDRLSFPPLRT